MCGSFISVSEIDELTKFEFNAKSFTSYKLIKFNFQFEIQLMASAIDILHKF